MFLFSLQISSTPDIVIHRIHWSLIYGAHVLACYCQLVVVLVFCSTLVHPCVSVLVCQWSRAADIRQCLLSGLSGGRKGTVSFLTLLQSN